MAVNKQARNVGNLGDVVKHGALVRLGKAIRPRLYVESHAFLLEAACPDPERWLRDVARELARWPAYLEYFRLEHPVVDGAPYRCSARLALDVAAPAAVVLAEANPETRAALVGQLAAAGRADAVVLSDARDLADLAPPAAEGAALALVDPFVLEAPAWESIGRGLTRIAEAADGLAALVFTFDDSADQVAWPAAPPGLGGPVAREHRRPYHLAAYATAPVAGLVERELAALGWITSARTR